MRQMTANKLSSRALARLGVLTDKTRAERLAQFLRDTSASDPRRQQVEALLQTNTGSR